jgi:hypothetical protein
MSVHVLEVTSLCLSEYYRLCPYFCAQITGRIGMSVRILQAVSVFLRAFTRCTRVSVRILQDVSVCMSVRILQVVCLCLRITGSLLSACTKLFPFACLSANYRYCSLHNAGYGHVSPDPAGSVACFRIFQVASFSKGTDNQRHCYVGDSYRPIAHTGSL